MKKLLWYTSIFLFAGVIYSCSKGRSSNITPTETSLMGTYNLSAETGKPESGVQFNALDSLVACERDDELRLNANLTYDYIDTGIVCSPSGNYSGTWDLPNSNTLVLDHFSQYTIKSFNNKTLVLVYVDLYSSPTITYTLTLVKE